MHKIGDFVTNKNAEDWGIGKIIDVSGQYITVYFSDLDDNKDFLKSLHPLTKATNEQISHSKAMHQDQSTTEIKPKASSLTNRVDRDKKNAHEAQELAAQKLKQADYKETIDFIMGPSQSYKQRMDTHYKEINSLQAIIQFPFHFMLEADISTNSVKKYQLLYANTHSSHNTILGTGKDSINILAWTHPAIQIGSTYNLHEEVYIRSHGYALKSVKPITRAKYRQVLPEIAGLYEPGGVVGKIEKAKAKTGLKAVKLEMTRDQVDAFLSKMTGMMLVSGAPGSGKTTVAMQRIRFLYDQQNERLENLKVKYEPDLTRIFLANDHLIRYSKSLLENDLDIPSDVVELVEAFVAKYLASIWEYKHNAKPRKKKLFIHEKRGHQAFWGLCSSKDLKNCWAAFESQITERLGQAKDALWLNISTSQKSQIALDKLSARLSNLSTTQIGVSPAESLLNMDLIYKSVRQEYENARILIIEDKQIETFDQEFQKWLFWVYDPMEALKSYFSDDLYQGGIRIKNGVGFKVREDTVIEGIKADWQNRIYGKEEEPWIAFLLRFSLPAEKDYKQRFREIPNPLDIAETSTGERWTHVMVDEAQDLCVAEAALLSSFVHPDGAFTVSADFHQIVSPVWGMESPEAFRFGCSLRDKGAFQKYPFSKNMRQSRQIGLFLRSFYENLFGEIAPFSENDIVEGAKPLLFIGNSSIFAEMIKRRLNVLKRNNEINSIALIQVDEDEEALSQYRKKLNEIGVTTAPIWQSYGEPEELVTTSVERIKGLEYDACFVIGMDAIENSALKHSKNRAYVALSRPSFQLTILCEEIPKSLQRIDKDLLEIIHI